MSSKTPFHYNKKKKPDIPQIIFNDPIDAIKERVPTVSFNLDEDDSSKVTHTPNQGNLRRAKSILVPGLIDRDTAKSNSPPSLVLNTSMFSSPGSPIRNRHLIPELIDPSDKNNSSKRKSLIAPLSPLLFGDESLLPDDDEDDEKNMMNGLNAALGDSKAGWMPLGKDLGRSNAILKKHSYEHLPATNDNRSPRESRRSSLISETHSTFYGGSSSPRVGEIDSVLGEPTDAIRLDNLAPRNNNTYNPNISTKEMLYHPNSAGLMTDLESGLMNTLSRSSSKPYNNDNNNMLRLPSPTGSGHVLASSKNPESNLRTAVKNLSLKINASSGADNESSDQASYYDAIDLNIDRLSVNFPRGSNQSFTSMDRDYIDHDTENLTPTATASFLTAPGFSKNASPNMSPRMLPHNGRLKTPLTDDLNSQFTGKSKISIESSTPYTNQQVFISSDTSSDFTNDAINNFNDSEKGTRLFGKSFGIFPVDSEFRLKCRDISSNPKLHMFMTSLILIQTGFLTYQQVSVNNGYVFRQSYSWVDWTMFVMYIIYTIEMAMKCVAFGVYDDSVMFRELRVEKKKSLLRRYYERIRKGVKRNKNYQVRLDENYELPLALCSSDDDDSSPDPRRNSMLHTVTVLPQHLPDISKQVRAYLRSDWNVVDFISIVSFWIGFGLSLSKVDLDHQVMIFRALMCLKILRLLNINQGSRKVLRGLKMSAVSSKEVTIFMICFWILFAIIGVQSFKASLRRHCVWTNPLDPTDTYTNDSQYCGAYILPNSTVMAYITSDGSNSDTIKGFTCPVYSRCLVGENPYGNSVSFDNIFNSLELVFIVISANTFTDLMYYTMDTDSMAAAIFFICGIVFLKIWLWSLIVAVIINTYKVSMQHNKEQKERKNGENNESLSDRRAKAKITYTEYVKGKKYLQKFIQYRSVFALAILVNFIRQCSRTYKDTQGDLYSLHLFECGTTIVLLFEIIILFVLFTPNWKIFFYSDLNCFDLLLAIVTSIIIIPSLYSRLDKVYPWLTVFQIARFYRVAVLNFTFVKDAWATVLTRTKPFLELCVFFILSLYLIGIIAARLFEGLISTEEYLSSNQLIMYNLQNVMLSLYVITSTENWTSILYLSQQCGLNTFSRFCVALFLILWFIFSNMVIISIFIAIITDNLDVSESEKRRKQIKQFYQKMLNNLNSDQQEEGLLDSLRRRVTKSTVTDHLSSVQMIEKMMLLLDDSYDINMLRDAPRGNLKSRIVKQATPLLERLPLYTEISKAASKLFSKLKHSEDVKDSESVTVRLTTQGTSSDLNIGLPSTTTNQAPFAYTTTDKHKRNDTVTSTTLLQETIDHEIRAITSKKPTNQRVLYLFSPKSRLRRFCQTLVSPPIGKRTEGVQPNLIAKDIFYITMFLFSVIVVIITCFVTPLYRRNHGIDFTSWTWVTYTDVLFSVIFTIEFVIKVIADGFLFTPNAYLRSTWEKIDFFVLLSFWCTAIFEINGKYDAVIIVGDFRALRALRLLTITKASKMHFQLAVVSAIKQITTGALVALSLLIPFSLYGLILFSDKLGYCLDGSTRMDCYNEYSTEVFKWDIVSPNNYVNPILYFDDFRSSISTLFQIISLEGWVDLLLNLMNITDAGLPPETFNSPGNGLFVVIFIFISIVFILNLFVSIIINNYAVQTGTAYLSDKQLGWYEVKRVLKQVRPSKRRAITHFKNKVQKKLYFLIINKNKTFLRMMDFFMFIHIIGLVTETYSASEQGNNGRYALVIISTSGLAIFNLLNLYAVGPKLYFKNKWNIYRIFITLGAFHLSIFAYITSRQSVYSNINKLFLVGILFLLIPRIDMLNQLLQFASGGLPSLISLLYMWLVIFLVFAIAMNQRFGLTKIGDNTTHNINCRTVTKTLIMLFRNSFGEGWNYIMSDFMVQYPLCSQESDYDSDCGNNGFAYTFFMGWNILSMYVILNILVSVVINNFSYIFNENGPHALLTRDELRKFKNSWNKYDPHGTGLMDPLDLQPFLSSLNGILSYKVYGEHYTIPKITNKWITRKSDDPYDIDIDFQKLDEVFACINFEKVKERKRRFNRLVIEAQLCMVETTDGLRIKFTDLLLLVGYYSRFEDSTCLTLEDFIKRYTLLQKVSKILRKLKIEATISMVLTRLRFKINKDKLLSTDPVITRSATIPEMLSNDAKNFARPRAVDPYNPFQNVELYRSVSRQSLNPFHDQSSSVSSLNIPTAEPAPYDDIEFKRRGTNTQ